MRQFRTLFLNNSVEITAASDHAFDHERKNEVEITAAVALLRSPLHGREGINQLTLRQLMHYNVIMRMFRLFSVNSGGQRVKRGTPNGPETTAARTSLRPPFVAPISCALMK